MVLLDFTPPIIAHRGASAYAPENTMAAFVKAAQLGIKWVEFDVVLAKCGMPIIFHDETLDRTSNAIGAIDAYPYEYLQTLDAGKWFHPSFSGERIPTLAQVLIFLREAGMSANVEIKPMPGREEETVIKTLEVMQALSLQKTCHPREGGDPCNGSLLEMGPRFRGDDGHILFSSFSVPSLRYLRKYAPNCDMGLLLENWELDWQAVCNELQCVSIHTDEVIINAETALKVKNMNKYLLCYTVNSPARAKELFALGVDAVFSDCPDVIERELSNGRLYRTV